MEALALSFLCFDRWTTHARAKHRIESMSPGELQLRVYSVDSLGHVALSGRIAEGKRAVEFQFELDPSYLSQIAAQLRGPGAR